MRTLLVGVFGLALVGASLAPYVAKTVPAPRVDVKTKIAELKQSLPSIGTTQETRDEIGAGLDSVRAEAERNRPYLAVHDLLTAWANLGVAEFSAKHTAAMQDKALYARIWKEGGTQAAGSDKKANPAQPLAVRGFAEYARDQANGYYRAAELYGKQTTLESGVGYAGLAQGLAAYADFCDQVDLAGGTAPPIRSIAGELDQLEARLLKAYEGAGESPDMSFITMSQALKTARELEARGWYAGALVAYLSVDKSLAEKTVAALPKDEVLRRLAAEKASWSAGADNSVPRYYTELATEKVESGNAGLLTASAIVTEVLPQYRFLIQPAKAKPARTLSARHVKVTLVRWPYT